MTATGTETSTLMGTQNADNVAITGGTIAGTVMTAPSGYSGTVTLATTTPVTVSSAAVAITSAIILSPNIVAVRTTTAPPTVTKIGAGQFEITGAASDSSVMNWAIIKTV